ncbi:MAG: amino acid ABC transporter permease [Pseudomonadota bacterium]
MEASPEAARRPRAAAGTGDFPWWLVAAALIGAILTWRIVADDLYSQVFAIVARGVGITVFVTLVAFALACLLGLVLAVAVLSPSLIARQVARFYIEIVRGIPILVLLFYIAFVATPGLVAAWNWLIEPLGFEPLLTRDVPLIWRAIIALTIGYSAYVAEVFRAGIEAIDRGQVEAAKALGFSAGQRFRLIVLPQAVRTMLPPLGNFFIAMIKDSSLVSVLGVADIAQMGKVYASGSFRYFEAYNVVTFIYLVMTIGLSLLLRRLERHLNRARMA